MKVWLWYGPKHGYWTWKTWATAQDETLFWIGWTLCQKSKYLIIATTQYGNKDWWKDYGLNIFLNLAGREAIKKEKIWSFGYSTIIHSSDHTIWFLAESRESFLVFKKKLLKAVMLIEITQIKYKEIKGIWAVSSLSCQPLMQIQCSQLKHEVIEDKTVFSVKSHFKRKGLELTLDLSLKLKLCTKYWIMIVLNFQTKRFMPLVTAGIKLSSNIATCLVNINCLHCERPNNFKNCLLLQSITMPPHKPRPPRQKMRQKLANHKLWC